MSLSKTERLLNLVATLLDTSRPLTVEELHDRIEGYPEDPESFRRAFERDKADLRDQGIPIDLLPVPGTDPQQMGYRVERRRYELPDPGLTPDEVAALQVAAGVVRMPGVGDAMGETLVRVAGEAPAGADPVAALADAPHMNLWAGAVIERREVRFGYRRGSEVLERHLQPHRLDLRQGRWFVQGRDLDRAEIRQFRLSGVEGTPKVGEPGAFAPVDAPDTRRLHGWELGDGPFERVRLLVDAEMAPFAVAELPDTESEERPDGAVVLHLDVRNMDGLVGFAFGLLEHAEVLDPPHAREAVIERLRAFVVDAPTGEEAR